MVYTSKRKGAPSEEEPNQPHPSSLPPRGKNLHDDLISSLEDEDMSDVTLVGSDNGTTNAIRAFLGARSDVLKSLLFGDFIESQRPRVKMNYPSAVIRGLIHFCVSDNAPKIDELRSLGEETDVSDEDLARLAVQLCVAAEYYQIQGLLVKGQDTLREWLRELGKKGKLSPAIFCAVFDETISNPCLPRLQAYLWLLVRNKPAKRLTKNGNDGFAGPSMLKSNTLRVLVEDQALSSQADVLFQAIAMWADATPPGEFEYLGPEERKGIAKELIAELELRLIPPPQLIGPVMASGYVESQKIVEVLQKQADGGAVYISGAGIAGSNGIYEQNHQYPKNDGSEIEAVYERRGTMDGMTVTFSLIASLIASSFGHMQYWVLMAPPAGAGNVVIEDFAVNRKLYYAERERSDSTAGDNIEWNSSSEDGVAPAPSMKFLPRMASINTFWKHKDASNLRPQVNNNESLSFFDHRRALFGAPGLNLNNP